MKSLEFKYESICGVPRDELAHLGVQLQPEIERVTAALKTGYESPYASAHLVYDEQLIGSVEALAHQKKELEPTVLVLIGIGGSNLGTMALLEALYGTFYNEQQPDIKVYFADTVDTDYIYDIVLLVEQEMEKGKNVLITVVSKSGTTMETVANAEIFIYLLKKYKPDTYDRYIVAITDNNSQLWQLAQSHHIDCLAIPDLVGGRYSVFSAVGLFPLALLGVDIKQLHRGARDMVSRCTTADFFENPAALSAAILVYNYRKGYIIHDTFLFSVDLENLGKWYRQLMGESIGKTRSSDGKEVGITPTVSIGSTDLHSVAQLYLGGPHDKFTTFVEVKQNKSNLVVPEGSVLHSLIASLANKELSFIMNAVCKGIQAAYEQQKRPFVHMQIPAKSADCIAQFMQCKMIEMMYVGYLLGVNPFDQPHVELYKTQTRKMLQ